MFLKYNMEKTWVFFREKCHFQMETMDIQKTVILTSTH
jgi:hypothetical protein